MDIYEKLAKVHIKITCIFFLIALLLRRKKKMRECRYCTEQYTVDSEKSDTEGKKKFRVHSYALFR